MFFAEEKFANRAAEMAVRRYVDMKTIAPMTAMPDDADVDYVHHGMPEVIEGADFNLGDHFIGRDRYLWITKTITLPEHRDGYEVVGCFNFGETGGGFNSGFESLLYVDGAPYQGVDTYHNDVVFENMNGQEVNLTFMLWTGLEGGGPHRDFFHRFRQADIGYLHKDADTMYYFTKAITGTIPLLNEDDPVRYKLTAALDRALKLINWDQDKYIETITPALNCLMDELEKIEKHTDITVNCVGHTHIDVAWLWRLKHTREKAQRSFATVMRYMEEYDEYIFLQSQPQLYKYIKNDCPELYEKIKERVAEGRWEAEGGMWLEADCNITSGESLARQFQHGVRFLKNEFGKTCEYLWLPDVFGYSWALPQILKLSNIKTFMTTKIGWNQYNTIPNDVFKWRGIDGSEVLTYFIETPSVAEQFDQRGATYNGMITPVSTLGSWKKFKNKNLFNETLVSYGHGDGGGGVDHDMLKMRRVLDKIPGLPHVKTGRADEFFRRLHEAVDNTDEYVATWDGELYLEYHRGTYTSQAHNKMMNRKLEFKLNQAEWLSSMAYILGNDYDSETIYEGWEDVLLMQFHDIIPGSSIHEVYEDTRKIYARIDADTDRVIDGALNAIIDDEAGAVTVYNFGSFKRESLVYIPTEGEAAWAEEDGTVLKAQKTEGGYYVSVPMDALSMKTIYRKDAADVSDFPFAVDLEASTIETPHYTLQWNDQNFLCRVYDKDNDREVIQGLGNALEIFEDKPMRYDAWDIDIFYTQKKEYAKPAAAPVLVEQGPLKAVIRFTYKYNVSTITQDLVVYCDSRRIDFVTHVDWHEDHRLLKAAFETDIRSTKATYDIQYGHVERPTHFNTSWDWARFEVVGHKWADLSEKNYGVSILNDCKYGYNTKDSTIKISLLKSSKHPDTSADMGEHDFTYSLYPHANGPVEGGTIEESVILNLPLKSVSGASRLSGKSFFRIAGEGIHIDAVKKAEDEDCIILRFHECYGGTQKIAVTSDFGIKDFTPCNLLEDSIGDTVYGDTIARTVKPFEICCYKIHF